MARTRPQNPWEKDPIVPVDPRIDEREKAETRYRNTTGDQNPLAQPPILPGEEGYAGEGQYLPAAGVVVRGPWEADPVATESQIGASERARTIVGDTNTDNRENALYQGVTFGFADELGGNLAGWGQQLRNIGRTLNGEPIEIRGADLRDAVIEQTRAGNADFRKTNPVQSAAFELAGGALTGGGTVGSGVRGLIATGALYGGAYGAGTGEGGIADRAPGALIGAGTGAAGGAALGIAAPYAQRLGSIAGGLVPQPVREFAGRLGTARPAPEVVAARRLSSVITPESLAERDRLRGLGLNPSVLDTLDNTGERMIRSAAGPAGPGADAAVTYARSRAADLKPEIMGVTRGLSPDPRTATQVREGLEETRDALATTQYRQPYAAQVPLTPEAVRSIRGGGQSAIREAIQDELASPNFDADVVAELEGLLTADLDRIPSVSGRALDRVRIALRDTSAGLMRGERPNRTRASGFAERVRGVDTALDAAPGLTEARATYRDLSGAVDQIDNASGIFNTDPADFARQVQGMSETQRQAAIVGLRQEILDTLGGQRAAGTGSLQNLAESTYARQNLATLLGPEEAAQYIGRIEAGVQQAQRAARISPNTNSQTFGRGVDDETFNTANMIGATVDVGQSLTGNVMAMGRTIDRIASRATLSPQERAAIVELGIGSADEIERIVRIAQESRARNRPPPREVRAWIVNAQNVLGPRNPIAQQLEQALLPTRVAAEEEQR